MLKKKLITAAVSACLLAAGQCGAQETTGRTKIAFGAEEALLYRGEAAQKSVSGDMSYADLVSGEASDIYSQAEKTSAFSECRDICVNTVLDGGKMKTEEEAEEYLMRITHDFMSRMIYGRPDIFAVRPYGFIWTVPAGAYGADEPVRASLLISMRETSPDAKKYIEEFERNAEGAVSDIRADSDYNTDGRTDTEELIRGVYEKARNLLSPCDPAKNSGTAENAACAFVPEYGGNVSGFAYASAVKVLCDRLGIGCMIVGAGDEDSPAYANAVRIGGGTWLLDAYTDDLYGQDIAQGEFLLHDGRGENGGNMFAGCGVNGYGGDVFVAGFPGTGVEISESPFRYDYTHHHAYSEVYIEPSCTSDGYIEGTCACGDTIRYNITKAFGHDPVVTDEEKPTCRKKGYSKTKCSRCGEETVEILPALGHDYEKTVTPPTCTQSGYTTNVCRRCGDTFTDSETEPLGHDFSGHAVEKGATCLSPGFRERTCGRCGYTETEETSPPVEHDYRAQETDPPTCTKDGCTFYVCNRCGKIMQGDIVPATGHEYVEETVEATCTTDGYTRLTCAKCGDIRDMETIPAYGHEWEILEAVDSTEEEEGHVLKVCTRCGEEKNVPVEKKK